MHFIKHPVKNLQLVNRYLSVKFTECKKEDCSALLFQIRLENFYSQDWCLYFRGDSDGGWWSSEALMADGVVDFALCSVVTAVSLVTDMTSCDVRPIYSCRFACALGLLVEDWSHVFSFHQLLLSWITIIRTRNSHQCKQFFGNLKKND